MTEHNPNESNQDQYDEDARTDVLAALALVGITVATIIYWVAGH